MTPANDKLPNDKLPSGPAGERILDHNLLQLSALMDGAVSPDEARFLLRRLQHDEELAGCWARWQLCGDVLRGHASEMVPPGFSRRVADAIAAEGSRPARRGDHWARWGGGAALAATVAVVALFMARQLPDARAPVRAPSQIPAQVARSAASVPALNSPSPTSPVPDTAGQLAAAVAVADVPRRAVRRSRGQSQRAAKRIAPVRAPQAEVAIAASATPIDANPFAPRTVVQSRPWPRALLPNSPASGTFTVDYGNVATGSAFHPFAPPTFVGAPAQTTPPVEGDRDPTAAEDGGYTP